MKLHLPKKLLAAVLACVFAAGTAYAEVTYTDTSATLLNVININFAGDQASTNNKPGEVSLPYGEQSYSYTSTAWTTVNGANGSATVYDTAGNEYSLSWQSPNTWSNGTSANTLAGAIVKGYLDMASGGSATFSLTTTDGSDLAWQQVNIIFSGDNGNTLGKVAVNQTEYYYKDGALTTVPEGENPTWGTRTASTTLTEGTNMMCVTRNASDTQQSLTVTGKSNGGNRATIAGAQIVLGEFTDTFTGTISGLEEGTSAIASDLGLKTLYRGTFTVDITATTDIADDVAVLTLNQNLQVEKLSVNGGALRLEAVEGNTFRGSIEVGSNASLALNNAGNAVLVNNLTLNDGATATVAGNLSLSGTVTNTGTGAFILEKGAGVAIGTKLASDIAANTFQAEGESTLSIAGNYGAPSDFMAALNSFSGEGTLKFVDAQTDMQPNQNAFEGRVENKKVIFDQGIVFTGTSGEHAPQNFTIGRGAEVTVNNAVLEARRMNVNVEGGKLTANAGILIGHPADGDYSGWVNLREGEIVTSFIKGQNRNAGSAFTMTNGTLTITGENAFGLTATDSKKLTVNLQGGTITTTSAQMNFAENSESDNLAFTIGNVTFATGDNHAIDLNHAFTQTGTLTVTGSGMLTISGNVTLRNVEALSALGYSDKTETGNGYAGNKRYLLASDHSADTPNYSIAGTIADSDGNALEYSVDSKGVYIQTEGSDFTYYINTGDVTYGDTDTHNAAAETTTGLSLNGGNLILDRGLTSQAQEGTGIVAQQAATVTIREGVTLSQSHLTANAATQLDGAGTYDMGTANAFATNVSLADSWTGVVELSGAHGGPFDINTYANENSKVRLVGVSAWLRLGAQISRELILANGENGEAGLNINAMSVNQTYTFSDKISGSGNFEVSDTNGQSGITVKFTGDVSGWTGTFIHTSGGSKTVEFGGSATAINAAIENRSTTGSLRLTTSGNEAKTFNGNVNVTSATLGGGAVTFTKDLTLHGNSAFNTDTTLSGKLFMENNNTLTIAAGKTLTHDGFTYTAGADAAGSIAKTADSGTDYYNSNTNIVSAFYSTGTTVSGVTMTKTSTEAKTVKFALSNVHFVNQSNTTSLMHDGNQLSALEISGGTVHLGGNLSVGTEDAVGTITMGNGAKLTIAGTKKLTYYTTVADGAAATMNIGTLASGSNATITSSAANTALSVESSAITFENSDIAISTTADITNAATLKNSKLTVTGGSGSVATKVEEGSTNSFDASEGSVSVNTGTADTAQVKDLTVGADQNATFTTADNSTAAVVVSGTADVAGSVIADVTVQSGNEAAPATFTAKDHAAVDGSLTITASGQLSIAGEAVADKALTVTGTMTLEADSVLDLTELGITKQTGTQTFVIAKAAGFSIDAATRVLGLDNLSWTLSNNAGATLLSSGDAAPVTPAMLFSMRSADDTLTLTVLGESTPDSLTATTVANYDSASDVLTIGVSQSLNGKTGDFNVIVGEEAWDAIVAAMEPNGGIGQEVFVTLVGTDDKSIDLRTYEGVVTLNGDPGTGTKGEYRVSYIPEPATATLSLLALAALAARRRRK